MHKYLVIILPWDKYVYLKMPMGLNISADVFQRELSRLFEGIPYVLVYIDDILIITKETFEQHLQAVKTVLKKLLKVGMQLNIDKSHFATIEVSYLGYIINRTGITPQPSKVQIIVDVSRPKTSTRVKRFGGMVNFYHDFWPKRAYYLAPIMALTKGKKKNGPIVWTEEAIESFEKIKTIIAEDAILHCPDFGKEFEIHTDSSNYQMGAVISQGGRPVAYWSKKETQ